MTSVGSLEADYLVVTRGCGLLDRSERGKLALSGTDAKAFLQGQVTNDIEALSDGAGCYAAFLTPKGKMLGDVRILDAGDELLLDTERIALQELFNMIRRFSVGYAVELHKRTLECGLLSLIGPRADDILDAAGADAGRRTPPVTENAHAAGRIGSARVRLIRTDVGVDLLCDAADLDAARIALVAAGATPVDGQAAECLRIEHGRPRYGVDIDDSVIPQEAGLNDRAVSFTKGCYVGQETVARLFYRGKPNRQLRGLLADAPLAAGAELTHDDRVVGRITSAVISPRLGPIGLALIRREAPVGAIVSVGAIVPLVPAGAVVSVGAVDPAGAGGASAEVVELPFRPRDESA